MSPFSLNPMLLLGSAMAATGCSLVLAVQLRRVKSELTRLRAEQARQAALETACAEAREEVGQMPTAFSDSLLQASLKQRLQKVPDWRQPPEKYRYAAALAEQGMDADGIAAVLQFPIGEAQQLIALKRAAQAQQNRLANAAKDKCN